MSGNPYRWLMTGVGEPMTRCDFTVDALADDEVLVEVAGCGVCHTDLGYYYDGVRTNLSLPLALGHEISGRVTQAGVAASGWLGRAVIVPAVIPCGKCELCVTGHGTICRDQVMPGNDIQGGFASHVVVPARGLCRVDEARLAAAGLGLADVSVVADAVTTPYQAVLQAEVEPGDVAIVIGVGGVGGYAVQIAHAFGAHVIAVDVDPGKLELMTQHGAALTLDARELSGRDLKKAVEAHCRGNGLRTNRWKIFECSGSGAGQTNAYGLLTHGATLAVVGFTMDRIEVRLSNLMAFHARALGNWGCLPEHYPAALDLVLDGRIDLASFVERHPLDQINEVFEAAHAHRLGRRAILTP
ncbi:6-hydroxycyclohex-1-ene-1-carbonyl-CoA dehydrogenase [Rhodocyclaceae bacterium SMB388]